MLQLWLNYNYFTFYRHGFHYSSTFQLTNSRKGLRTSVEADSLSRSGAVAVTLLLIGQVLRVPVQRRQLVREPQLHVLHEPGEAPPFQGPASLENTILGKSWAAGDPSNHCHVRAAAQTDGVRWGRERFISFYCRSAVRDSVWSRGSLDNEIWTLSDRQLTGRFPHLVSAELEHMWLIDFKCTSLNLGRNFSASQLLILRDFSDTM